MSGGSSAVCSATHGPPDRASHSRACRAHRAQRVHRTRSAQRSSRVLSLLSLSLLFALPSGCSEEEPGARESSRCTPSSCPEGQRCVADLEGTPSCQPERERDLSPPLPLADQSPRGAGTEQGIPPADCLSPSAGTLSLNEALINPEGADSGEEFIELVNLSGEPRTLDGLVLTIEGNQRLQIRGGCIAAHGAVAIRSDPERWRWAPDPVTRPEVELRSLSLVNTRPFRFELLDARGELLDLFEGERALIVSGVSVTRTPDPGGAALALHSELGGRLSSPARCANGGSYARRCEDGAPLPDLGPPEQGAPERGAPVDLGATDRQPSDGMSADQGERVDQALAAEDAGLDQHSVDQRVADQQLVDQQPMVPSDDMEGPEDAGPEDAGPEDASPEDAGPEDAGPEDAGPEDARPPCAPPSPGALVLNELLIDAEAEPSGEFVELVNNSDRAVELAGLTLVEGPDTVRFQSGCLPSRGAIAIYGAGTETWVLSLPVPALDASGRLRLANAAELTVSLLDAEGQPLSTISGRSPGEEQSRNRSPDLLGELTVPHRELSALSQSPARCPNGGWYHEACALPE